MDATLLTGGIACIIAAIAGGGLKAFGIEIRVLDSGRRQLALGAFGLLLVAAGLQLRGFFPFTGTSPPPTTETSAPATLAANCRPEWFGSSPPDRVTAVESGAADVELVAASESKDPTIVVVVTENGKPVGAVAFRLFTSNDLFKITEVVNASCEPVDTFRNESRGGDPHVLQNYDTLELTFGTLKYALRLGYGSGTVGGTLTRISLR